MGARGNEEPVTDGGGDAERGAGSTAVVRGAGEEEAGQGEGEMRKQPFRLVQLNQSVSHDTVRCLRQLLADAEAGKIVGISYAVMASNRKFFYSSCGEAYRNPAFATAMAATLLHGTMKRVFGEG